MVNPIIVQPISSAIAEITWHPVSHFMSVEFVDRDRIYFYEDVPENIFVEFAQGGEFSSVGTYYHKRIKGSYNLAPESGE